MIYMKIRICFFVLIILHSYSSLAYPPEQILPEQENTEEQKHPSGKIVLASSPRDQSISDRWGPATSVGCLLGYTFSSTTYLCCPCWLPSALGCLIGVACMGPSEEDGESKYQVEATCQPLPRGDYDEDDVCPICTEEFRKLVDNRTLVVETPCHHRFCAPCYEQLLNSGARKCPTCRGAIPMDGEIELYR